MHCVVTYASLSADEQLHKSDPIHMRTGIGRHNGDSMPSPCHGSKTRSVCLHVCTAVHLEMCGPPVVQADKLSGEWKLVIIKQAKC